jgi:hypothetical protein
MRARFLTPVALFVFATTSFADDAADARAVVEKAIKATGQQPGTTPAAIAWKEKGKFTGGGFEMNYTGEYAFQAPDKYRFKLSGSFGGMDVTFTAVANGAKAWQSGFGMTEEMAGEKLAYFLDQVHLMQAITLRPLLADKDFQLATAGEKDVGGKKAAGVKVTRDKRPPVTLYFDKETGLLVGADTTVRDEFQGWKEVPEEVSFSDYKDAGGKKVFTRMKIVRDGKPMIDAAVSERKEVEKLDPKLFEKP